MNNRAASEIRGRKRIVPQRGFTVLQLIIVVAIISIVSTFALVSVARSRESIRLQNSMRLFAGRLEKARLDAIRRHKSSLVEFTNSNTYTITMDFDGNGTTAARTFSLENNVTITNSDGSTVTDFPVIDFDWRGRTTQCFTSVRMKNSRDEASTISVTSSGDVTIDTTLGATVSPGTYSNINQTSDIASSATVSGSSAAACIDPCGSCGSSSSGSSTVTSSPPAGCAAFTVNKSSISIKKNGATTDSFTVNVTTADTITVTQTDGRTNLSFSPSATQSIGAGSSKSFTVKSLNNSKGKFPIRFTSACNSSNIVDATVTVTN